MHIYTYEYISGTWGSRQGVCTLLLGTRLLPLIDIWNRALHKYICDVYIYTIYTIYIDI